MAITDDVLVVGGGIAACTAVLSATEMGAHVRLLAHKKSILRQVSSLVDVLGYAGSDGPLSDPYTGLDAPPEGYPYHVVGEDSVRAGLHIFDEAVGDAYRGGHTDSNALVMTHGGAVKPTARYPASVAPGLISSSGDTLLIGFAGLADFDAPAAADHLAATGMPFSARGVTVEFPKRFRVDAKVTRFAKALDRDEDADDDTVRSVLADAVAEELDDESRVGFPATFDDDHDGDVRAELSDRLSVPVFEVPTGPPSLLGLRLEGILFGALDEAGVRISVGNPAVDFKTDTGRVEAVVVDQKNRPAPCSADQVVLATGSLVGKGLDSDRESVTESAFGCHVPYPEDRYDWPDPEVFDDHAFVRFGVVPDDELRPADEDDEPYFESLRAASGVVGGADAACEKSASGVSLVTGAVAGQLASEEAAR